MREILFWTPSQVSGTTGAVAHKLRRRWIMVEVGDHCDTRVAPRLKKVIDGQDLGGITEGRIVARWRWFPVLPARPFAA